ncbi:MAG TPA: malto-oligosyltrehalose synthase [Mycobacteriales bacterium]|nr:malto-oligosyltrehalose synthase [Mycobacteriales bacterium]
MPAPGPPTATYRLQLRREFGFLDAAAVVPYLASLGVSHVYCSPVLAAMPGSAHGYDVVDHSRLSPELGGDEGWAGLTAACREHGLGIVVDVVPNHMAVPTPERLNRQLWDVLQHGRDAQHADWFDIDWDSQAGRLLMPVLGGPLDDVLARGEISVDPDAEVLRYFDHELPLAPGTAAGADDVRRLLERQHYRLADWRRARTELNYRRFFDVTSLIGVRVELPHVFDATHARLLELVRAGDVDGLRIDHPDGLADPAGYLRRLAEATGGTWTVVEKILESGEVLPRQWACAGTTGYDALDAVTGVFTDPAGAQPLTDAYTTCTGADPDYDAVVVSAKHQVVDQLFVAEVTRLVRELRRPPLDRTLPPELTDDDLAAAVGELLVAFDVYRAYPGDPASERRIDDAVARAARRAPRLAAAVEALRPLLHRASESAAPFAVRFEQTTGPVMAKGIEDTAFYRYLRLTALNEVGGDPGRVGLAVEAWHEHCRRLARDRPAAMTTLSTHDTKRSEDVRARLLVLAEIPGEWTAAVERWRVDAPVEPPDPSTEYLFWQSLVGTMSPSGEPISADRLLSYLVKASREAKQHTSWTDPDEAYEERLATYVRGVLDDEQVMTDVATWSATHLRSAADANVLGQKLVQLTMPGVPDVYQGQELSDLSLVDPDNRRAVDYDRRRSRLAALETDEPAADDKLLVTARTLRLRRERPDAFAGGYVPVAASGHAAEHLLAFRRAADVAVVATRLPAGLRRKGGWQDTRLELPAGTWHDRLSGRRAMPSAATLLADLPVALLVRTGG